jgi:hypothetical protein
MLRQERKGGEEMTVNNIDKIGIKERLKKTDKEAYDLVIALEDIFNKQVEITNILKKKLKNNNWISITDRLPENTTDIFVNTKNHGSSIGYYDPVNKIWYQLLRELYYKADDVTYWQPFPEDPNE